MNTPLGEALKWNITDNSSFITAYEMLCTLSTAYNEFGYNEHPTKKRRFICGKITLGPAYDEFGYYEQPPTASIKIIDSNVKKFQLP